MDKYLIGTLNNISQKGLCRLTDKYELTEDVDKANGIIVRSFKMHDMDFSDDLLAIGRAGAGVNNIPLDKCAEKGIVVFNTPGANSNAVKELAVAGMIMGARNMYEGIAWGQTLEGDVASNVEKGKKQFAGTEIAGKTLGVIGLGAIGAKIANAAESLGMKVIGYDPFLSVGAALHLEPSVKIVSDINEIYSNSDYITIHMPYTPQTKNTIDAEQIAMMKDGVRLINLARGELINSEAVVKAIADGKIAKYVTDFADDVVLGAENVIVLPHLGASTPESEDNCAVMAAEELIEYIENGNIKNSVNLPNASMNAVGTKICIIHKNVPTTIASITSVVGNEGINIENMVNASKKDFAYTMLDVIGDVPATVEGKINAVDGVIRVRVINK
jgi:D-3-phosphoglycerate dehydrogenase